MRIDINYILTPQALSTIALGLTLTLSSRITEAQSSVTVVADGLNNPRGLDFAPNGALFVAEAGIGAGDGNGGSALGIGFTGSITEINGVNSAQPVWHRLVTGLASIGDIEGGALQVQGPSGVSVHGTGGIYISIGQSALGVEADNSNVPVTAEREFGHLLKLTPSGHWKLVADVGDFDYVWTAANKDQPWAPAGQFPDANPYGVLALGGRQFIADAAANTIDEVRPNGSIRIVAFVPNPQLPLPNGKLATVSDAVPTCVALGPDGYLYVGTLAFGANFARFSPTAPPNWATLPPQSKIYRVNPNGSEVFLTDSDVWASGFNPIVGCGFNRGALYVTEFETQQSGYSSGDVVRVELTPAGPGARTTLGANTLHQPNGLAFDRAGNVYVSNNSTSAGTGQVVRLNF